MHDPQKPRLPGDYSHILPPEKPTAAQELGLAEIRETRFPPPLTKEQFERIRERYKGDPDIEALLWDRARMKNLLVWIDQFLRSYPAPASIKIMEFLAMELREEPSIQELRRDWEAAESKKKKPEK